MGLKYYGRLNIDVLVNILFEYGTISRSQFIKILSGYGLKEHEQMSILIKLRRNPSVCMMDKSHILGGKQQTCEDKYFASDFINYASRVASTEHCLWVLLDYIFEVDYHFCCGEPCQNLGPSVAFGIENSHYEVFYVRQGDEEFFNTVAEAQVKELIYKTNLAKKEGWTTSDTANSLFSTERFIVVDNSEQITKLTVPNVISYCVVRPDHTVEYIRGE